MTFSGVMMILRRVTRSLHRISTLSVIAELVSVERSRIRMSISTILLALFHGYE
ncbi:hypothetical protein AHAS_Ahas20G0229300 [Arachis hypogaea]